MAEFCLNCWNEMNETHLTEEDVILTEYLDLCEGCGEFKQVVDGYKKRLKELAYNAAQLVDQKTAKKLGNGPGEVSPGPLPVHTGCGASFPSPIL